MNDIYKLYTKCFERYPVSYELFVKLLRPDLAHLIFVHHGEQLIGFSMIHDNSISLLCVDSNYRNKGYGRSLLKSSEDYIKLHSSKEIILGGGEYYLLQGVPEDHPNVISFFMNNGYRAEWTSVNMELLLEGYDVEDTDIPVCSESIKFEFCDHSRKELLMDAVKDVEASWISIYKNCNDPIMLAMFNEDIVGFLILSPDGGRFKTSDKKIGAIGCVGVVHEAREKGIGRRMVLNGISWLKKQGCSSIELRYVELVDWYKTLGFYVIHKQWMGTKKNI